MWTKQEAAINKTTVVLFGYIWHTVLNKLSSQCCTSTIDMADIDATQKPTVEGVDPIIDDGDEFESKVSFLQHLEYTFISDFACRKFSS